MNAPPLAFPETPPNRVIAAMLEPLSQYYNDHKVIELRMNGSGRLTREIRGVGKVEVADSALTIGMMKKLCKTLANYHGLVFDANSEPNLSCVLPGKHRFECLIGASVQERLSLSIRCKHPYDAKPSSFGLDTAITERLFAAVQSGKHVVISGGTSSGKTTLLNLLLQSLPEETRIVCAEDAPEVNYSRFSQDSIGLLATRSVEVPGMLSWPNLTNHINRITPDRVIFGEISTLNAQSALAVLNAGIMGFMCTIHAESPEMVIKRKFAQNLDMAGTPMQAVDEFLDDMLDLVVQIKKTDYGTRKVTSVWDVKNKVELLGK